MFNVDVIKVFTAQSTYMLVILQSCGFSKKLCIIIKMIHGLLKKYYGKRVKPRIIYLGLLEINHRISSLCFGSKLNNKA